MEVFGELFVTADDAAMETVVRHLSAALPAGWTRGEPGLPSRAAGEPPTYCFECAPGPNLPPARLYLRRQGAGRYDVSNIVPVGRHRLAPDEYNAVLTSFAELLFPVCRSFGLACERTETEVGPETWFAPETAAKLRRFSRTADRFTGAALPVDRALWKDFILGAHGEGATVDPDTLARWLTEVGGWAPDVADQLAFEYSYGRDLLAYVDGRRSA